MALLPSVASGHGTVRRSLYRHGGRPVPRRHEAPFTTKGANAARTVPLSGRKTRALFRVCRSTPTGCSMCCCRACRTLALWRRPGHVPPRAGHGQSTTALRAHVDLGLRQAGHGVRSAPLFRAKTPLVGCQGDGKKPEPSERSLQRDWSHAKARLFQRPGAGRLRAGETTRCPDPAPEVWRLPRAIGA